MKKILKYILILFFLLILTLCFYFYQSIIFGFETFAKYLYPKNENGKGELLKVILSVIGALAVIYGLYISLRRAKAMELGVKKQGESIENQVRQLELSRKSQIDERFKNSIEHLGSDKEPVILGGIAELHQIAKENKIDYAEVVFNILCSYIRTTANIYDKKADDINKTAIQTIVNYIFKKKSNSGLYENLSANISFTNLFGIDLSDCNLRNSNMSFCYLQNLDNSDLSYSKLSGSIIRIATINKVSFDYTDLFKTLFHACKISDSSFQFLSSSGCSFLSCELNQLNFDNNDFYNIQFLASIVRGVSFNKCGIIGASFSCSHIEDVDFSTLSLFGNVDFRATSFSKVDFRSIITESNFRGANIELNEFPPQLYKERLSQRLDKPCEIEGLSSAPWKSDIGKLQQKDVDEIIRKIQELENKRIKKGED